MQDTRRRDDRTFAEALGDLPMGVWVFLAALVICATALTIFYFAEIRTPAPLPSTRSACVAAGHHWNASVYYPDQACEP